ncbi:hypothetical protein V1264_007241 [Littorina saxatilis]|uniref:Uncharacterized protein n=1 Tax=Littorina saxatilis TaxID=31220 RepID=A0AAN9AV24_9CAEN
MLRCFVCPACRHSDQILPPRTMPKQKQKKPAPAAATVRTKPVSTRVNHNPQRAPTGTTPPWMGQLIQSLDDKIQASVQAAMESHLRSVEAAPQPLSTPQQGNMTNTDYSDNLATLIDTQASSASTSRLSGLEGSQTCLLVRRCGFEQYNYCN